ncbi:kinesin-like protein KIF16B isoform X1 [Clytia hemisphaerica]|uniref:Kinesin-like protein KIF16B n=1 Tax=Clytia hemisphaerica TaxID=252671 RepID=A0A7M5UWC5_9CNID
MVAQRSTVKVGICICPRTADEKERGVQNIIHTEENEVKISMGNGKGQKSYEVDFEPFNFEAHDGVSSSLKEVCSNLGNTIIDQAFAGYNTTLFTYGAKGSGKTTVLFGNKEERGIISFILNNLFAAADQCDSDTSFRCEISFFELCGDTISDLVSKRQHRKSQEGIVKLKVREDSQKGIYVDKLSRHIVTDVEDATKLYDKGVKSRNRLATLDPDSKGTSHTIFSINFTQARLKDGLPMELVSKINIIDLGSRDGYQGNFGLNGFQNGKMPTDQELLDEDEKKGPLEALNDVINALAADNYGSINPMRSYGSMNPSSNVPYDSSNLTLYMKESMGGNCETIMLCCISPAERALRDTLNTLKYGNLARLIKNKPTLNEDQNVKLIRELKNEIDTLKNSNTASDGKKQQKLQRDQELMKRLTGIWEDKWSKAQKMIQDKDLNLTDLGGVGVKLETKEPHFVSLGGGRLSVGVSIIPIKRGFTRVGCGGDGYEVDLLVRGKGITNEHCLIEFDGEAVVLHPKNELCSVDGVPISEPTRLPQGCMVCIGQNNYFRFNHPKQAALIREQTKNSRFSIVPDAAVYPDVQLAIEQRRKEMQEKEKLRAENKRLQAMEQQYMQSLKHLEFERDQLEHEKTKLQILQQQQQNVANEFDRNVSIQIEELKIQKQELKRFETEKQKILEKEKEIDAIHSARDAKRQAKEEEQKSERDRILNVQASLDLEEFEALEKSMTEDKSQMKGLRTKAITLETEKHALALLELDILTEDLEVQDQYEQQKKDLQSEKEQLEQMERHHQELENNLSDQIQRLQRERERELEKIKQEKKRLHSLENEQTNAIERIELERQKLVTTQENEKQKLERERSVFIEAEHERMKILQNAFDEQEKERANIEREKMRLLDLEEQHKRALEELHQDMLSQQEKLERERKLEQEYIETEQLMLEELEQKQFESARQIEYEAQLIREQVEQEKKDEKAKHKLTERYVNELQRKQELALKQAEEERLNIQKKREEENLQLQAERHKLVKMEHDYQQYTKKLEEEKQQLREIFEREKQEEIARIKEEMSRDSMTSSSPSSPVSPVRLYGNELDPNLIIRNRTPEGKAQQIEEEKNRLSDLRRIASEKAELEWIEKKRDLERREIEEKELENKREMLEKLKKEQEEKAEQERQVIAQQTEKMKLQEDLLKQRERELAELHKERERREELERLLLHERAQENVLERTLNQEKEKFTTLERSLAEERSKRMETEKRLQEEETRNRTLEHKRGGGDTRSNGAMSGNGTLKRRVPSYTLSIRSGQSGNSEEVNLLHHVVAAGHVIENCPAVKINRYSCRGYLLKMGKSRLKVSWNKRWFVFDRKLRALLYYQDERKTKSKGILYFQSIQEVYVDSSIKKSPNSKTTFCVRTPQRNFYLSAPSPIAMSIWIDVICTGKEGAFTSMTL